MAQLYAYSWCLVSTGRECHDRVPEQSIGRGASALTQSPHRRRIGGTYSPRSEGSSAGLCPCPSHRTPPCRAANTSHNIVRTFLFQWTEASEHHVLLSVESQHKWQSTVHQCEKLNCYDYRRLQSVLWLLGLCDDFTEGHDVASSEGIQVRCWYLILLSAWTCRELVPGHEYTATKCEIPPWLHTHTHKARSKWESIFMNNFLVCFESILQIHNITRHQSHFTHFHCRIFVNPPVSLARVVLAIELNARKDAEDATRCPDVTPHRLRHINRREHTYWVPEVHYRRQANVVNHAILQDKPQLNQSLGSCDSSVGALRWRGLWAAVTLWSGSGL